MGHLKSGLMFVKIILSILVQMFSYNHSIQPNMLTRISEFNIMAKISPLICRL